MAFRSFAAVNGLRPPEAARDRASGDVRLSTGDGRAINSRKTSERRGFREVGGAPGRVGAVHPITVTPQYQGLELMTRHGRACPGHPHRPAAASQDENPPILSLFLRSGSSFAAWMAGSSPAMTAVSIFANWYNASRDMRGASAADAGAVKAQMKRGGRFLCPPIRYTRSAPQTLCTESRSRSSGGLLIDQPPMDASFHTSRRDALCNIKGWRPWAVGVRHRDETADRRERAHRAVSIDDGGRGRSIGPALIVAEARAVKARFTTLFAGVLFALACLGVAAAGPLEDGRAAYQRGDDATAMRLLRPLAEAGDAGAQTDVGWMYATGRGAPQDYAQALAWRRKAADQGDATAQFSLGIMYRQGQGAPQDFAQAAMWTRKAADQGHAGAQLSLGLMRRDGQGAPRDDVQAYMWFNLASRATESDLRIRGTENRDALAAKMTPAEIAEAQRMASEWKPK